MIKKLSKFFPKDRNLPALPSCTHDWHLFAKNFAPPRPDAMRLEGVDAAILERALLGVTTYLWECKFCSQVRKEETLGSDSNQLEEILDKALKYGIQYIEHDGTNFAIAKVPGRNEDTVALR